MAIFSENLNNKKEIVNHNCKIITIEGLDGSGKTTTVDYIINKLREKGYKAEHFYTSSNFNIYWEVVNELKQNNIIDTSTNQILHNIAMITYLKSDFIDLINTNDFILSEWYIYGKSVLSEVYEEKDSQSKKIIDYYLENGLLLYPDYSFFIDLSIEEALNRIKKRNGILELKESGKMLKKAKDIWEKYIYEYNIEKINGMSSTEEIGNYILKKVL